MLAAQRRTAPAWRAGFVHDKPLKNSVARTVAVIAVIAVIDALARRDQTRILVDGMTAANDLGLTDAVPARVTIYTDTQPRSIHLDKLTIDFKPTAPSRLYWAGRPAMRAVQALHWLKEMLPTDGDRVRKTLARLFANPEHGDAIRTDLAQGFGVLPASMQSFLRTLPGFDPTPPAASPAAAPASRRRASPSPRNPPVAR